MHVTNVFTDQFEYEEGPEGYRAGEAIFPPEMKGELNVRLYELPARQSLCPYHYEYVEEWLLLLDGAATVRTPEGEQDINRGDLVRFPTGPDGAHKVTTRGERTARILMLSSAREPAVAVYPDSDKVGVWAQETKLMLRREDGRVDYWDREA